MHTWQALDRDHLIPPLPSLGFTASQIKVTIATHLVLIFSHLDKLESTKLLPCPGAVEIKAPM